MTRREASNVHPWVEPETADADDSGNVVPCVGRAVDDSWLDRTRETL